MSRPNLILAIGHRHRLDCTGYAGHPVIKTPNLDALANGGAWFDAAETAAAAPVDALEALLDDDALAHLAAAGYHMGYAGPAAGVRDAFGSVSTASLPDGEAGDSTDYARWLEAQGHADPAAAWGGAAIDGAPSSYRGNFGALRSALPESAHVTAWLGSQAVGFVRSALEPFCLVVCFTRPGEPYDPPAMRERAYAVNDLPLPPDCRLPVSADDAARCPRFDFTAMTADRLCRALAHYYASITAVDQQLGRILATLQSRGLTRNLIGYTALGGELAGHRGLMGAADPAAFPILRRVPMVVAGVPGLEGGRHSEPVVTNRLLAQLTAAALDGAWPG